MTNSYLVCKIGKDDVQIIIDGLPKSISKQFKEADQVIALARSFNVSRDQDERNAILEKVKTLLTQQTAFSMLLMAVLSLMEEIRCILKVQLILFLTSLRRNL